MKSITDWSQLELDRHTDAQLFYAVCVIGGIVACGVVLGICLLLQLAGVKF